MPRASKLREPHELYGLALQACRIAQDAAFNTADLLRQHSTIAHVTVKQCERELDHLERQIDHEVPAAITQIGNEDDARELLAARRLITELERIGDLLWDVSNHLRPLLRELPKQDAEQLAAMAANVEQMLATAHAGLSERSAILANKVIRADSKINKLCRAIYQRYVLGAPENPHNAIAVVLAAQALERAGDHATNVGEVLLHLVERRSVLHSKRRLAEFH